MILTNKQIHDIWVDYITLNKSLSVVSKEHGLTKSFLKSELKLK